MGIENEEERKQKIKDSLANMIDKKIDISYSDKEINDFLVSFFEKKAKNDNESNKHIFIGSFPRCYKNESVDSLLAAFNDIIDSNYSLNQKLIWAIRTKRDQPETRIKEFLGDNLIKDKQQNPKSWEVECNRLTIDIVAFSPIDESINNAALHKIKRYIEDNDINIVSLNFLTKEKSIYDNIYKDTSKLFSDIKFNLESAKNIDKRKRARFIIKEAIELALKDTADKRRVAFFLGKMPDLGRKKIKDIKDLKGKKNYTVFIKIEPKKYEDVFVNAFRAENIKVVVIN